MRNAAGQEISGLRFTTTGAIQYQLPTGSWSNTGSNYSANVWYDLQINYDLTNYTYSAWLNGSTLVQDAAFRTNTSTAASLLVQDRVVAGSRSSFLDDVQVEHFDGTAAPEIISLQLGSGVAVLTWTSDTNKLYSLLAGTNIAPIESYSVSASNIPATAATCVFTTALQSAAAEFWAVLQQ